MHILSGFQIRQILDEVIAVPGGEVSKHFSGIISLNEVGEFLFKQLQTDQTPETLVCALLNEYEVDRDSAARDVEDFLSHLRTAGLLVE